MTERQLKEYERSHQYDVKKTLTENDKEYWDAPHTIFYAFPQHWHRGVRGPEGTAILETETCNSEDEIPSFKQRGFFYSSQDALAAYERQEESYAELAAEKHHGDARLSGPAQAEAAAQDAATEGHVTDPREKENLAKHKHKA